MTAAISNAKRLRREHGECCSVTRMREGQCSLTQPQSERFIASGTLYQGSHNFTGKLCDYIVFWKCAGIGESVAVVELKGGHVPSSAAIQLINGATIAAELALKGTPGFVALLVTKTAVHSIDRKFIARQRISFFGVNYPIKVVPCGSRLVDALSGANEQDGLIKSRQAIGRRDRTRRVR